MTPGATGTSLPQLVTLLRFAKELRSFACTAGAVAGHPVAASFRRRPVRVMRGREGAFSALPGTVTKRHKGPENRALTRICADVT